MELGENLKEHFSKTTFYGLHAGNNQNSIWKPHSNFAFPEPYKKNMFFNYFNLSTVTTEGLAHAHNPGTTIKRMRINLEIGALDTH